MTFIIIVVVLLISILCAHKSVCGEIFLPNLELVGFEFCWMSDFFLFVCWALLLFVVVVAGSYAWVLRSSLHSMVERQYLQI